MGQESGSRTPKKQRDRPAATQPITSRITLAFGQGGKSDSLSLRLPAAARLLGPVLGAGLEGSLLLFVEEAGLRDGGRGGGFAAGYADNAQDGDFG